MTRLRAAMCSAVAAVALVAGFALPVPASASLPAPINGTYFGYNWINRDAFPHWPALAGGSSRLWDIGTTWRDFQPTAPTYDPTTGAWTTTYDAAADARLRNAIAANAAHHVQTLIVLGGTPSWASAPGDVESPDCLTPGSCLYPDLTDPNAPSLGLDAWKQYVAHVVSIANLYKGNVVGYEVWNEANFPSFWDPNQPNAMARLVTLAQTARATIKATANSATTVLSPSIGARHPDSVRWMLGYLGAGGGGPTDAWAVHLYPTLGQAPENMLGVLGAIRAHAGGKAVWDTEVGYGLASSHYYYTGAAAYAAISRTFLLEASNHVARTFFYAYGDVATPGQTPYTGLNLTTGPDVAAERTAVGWVNKMRPLGCGHGSTRTTTYIWTCKFYRPDGRRSLAVWAFKGAPNFRTPLGTQRIYRLPNNTSAAAAGGKLIRLGVVPVLLVGTFR